MALSSLADDSLFRRFYQVSNQPEIWFLRSGTWRLRPLQIGLKSALTLEREERKFLWNWDKRTCLWGIWMSLEEFKLPIEMVINVLR